MGWTDGSWDQEQATGAVGGVLCSATGGGRSFGAQLPEHWRSALASSAKQQRNTQAELAAVAVFFSTWGPALRGHSLLLYQDNQAALANLCHGQPHDPQSVAITHHVWELVVRFDILLWVEWVHTAANPADAFSRPGEAAKQREALELIASLQLHPAEPRWPPADLDAWQGLRLDERLLHLAQVALHGPREATELVLGWCGTHKAEFVSHTTAAHGRLLAAVRHSIGKVDSAFRFTTVVCFAGQPRRGQHLDAVGPIFALTFPLSGRVETTWVRLSSARSLNTPGGLGHLFAFTSKHQRQLDAKQRRRLVALQLRP